MSVSHRLGISHVSDPATPQQRPALAWPVAASVIGAASLGLWALVYRLLKAVFGF